MKRCLAMLLGLSVLFSCIGCAASIQAEVSLPDGYLEHVAAPAQTPAMSNTASSPAPRPESALMTSAVFGVDFIESDTEYQDSGRYVESFTDGIVYAQSCCFPGQYNKASAISAVAKLAWVDVKAIKAQKTEVDSFTAYRLSYTWGTNEDTRICEDMAILTDDAMYLFHTMSPMELWEMYQCESYVTGWINGLYLAALPTDTPYMQPTVQKIDLLTAIPGWWVCMDRERMDPAFPIINYFSNDGDVFLSPEAYYASIEDDDVFSCKWEVSNGKAICWDIGAPGEAPVKCGIRMDDEESMIIVWPDGTTAFFMKNTTVKASLFLKKGEYSYLAQGPVLCNVIYNKQVNETCHSLLADDLVWVNWDDDDLIAEYHLENAWFDDDYELYNEAESYSPVVTMGDTGTKFTVINWNEDGTFVFEEVKTDEFMDILQSRGYPMLAYLKIEESDYEEGDFVSEIKEVYIP